jgi:hypothetical protein
MIDLKELADILKGTVSRLPLMYELRLQREQFSSAMGESSQVSGSSRITHRQAGTGIESVPDMQYHAQDHLSPLEVNAETGNYHNVQRRSRKANPKRLEDLSRTPRADDTERLQAQRIQFQQLKHEYNSLKAENDLRKNHLDELTNDNMVQKYYADRYNYILERVLMPYAQQRRLHFDHRTEDTLNFVLDPLLRDAQEAQTLQSQVQTLQKELLAREKITSVISDESFAKDFSRLAAQIKTLSRLLRPDQNLDIVECLGSCIIASGVEPHHWNSRAGKKIFIEAWTWSVLMRMVFRDPFTIFGAEGRTIANLWSSMYGTQHCHGWPEPSASCEAWRCRTVEQLVTVVDEKIITQGKTKVNYLYLEQNVVDARVGVIAAIETGLANITSMVDSSQILHIVDGAFTLCMHMSLQQPRLQIVFPKSGDNFDRIEMERQTILDEEDDIDSGIVAAIINPGLMKWGDIQGKNLDHRYAVVPALVRTQAPSIP